MFCVIIKKVCLLGCLVTAGFSTRNSCHGQGLLESECFAAEGKYTIQLHKDKSAQVVFSTHDNKQTAQANVGIKLADGASFKKITSIPFLKVSAFAIAISTDEAGKYTYHGITIYPTQNYTKLECQTAVLFRTDVYLNNVVIGTPRSDTIQALFTKMKNEDNSRRMEYGLMYNMDCFEYPTPGLMTNILNGEVVYDVSAEIIKKGVESVTAPDIKLMLK